MTAPCLTQNYGKQPDNSDTNAGPMLIAHALRADGFDASEDGTGRGTPLVPVSFAENQRGELVTSDTMGSLKVGGGKPGQGYPAIAFAGQAGGDRTASGACAEELSPTLHKSQIMDVMHRMQVRRLTPRECERLQGFVDDYTLVPYRGKPAADGPRYKALGNSMAVPCMAWIGRRLQFVHQLPLERKAIA